MFFFFFFFKQKTAYEMRISDWSSDVCSSDLHLDFAALDRLTQDFASYLQNVLGLHQSDRVALMMPNLLQYPVALFGVLRAGLVVVNANPLDRKSTRLNSSH